MMSARSTSPDSVRQNADALALWSATEVRTQAAQCAGQLDVWEALLETACDGCNAESGEQCAPGCCGYAAWLDTLDGAP